MVDLDFANVSLISTLHSIFKEHYTMPEICPSLLFRDYAFLFSFFTFPTDLFEPMVLLAYLISCIIIIVLSI